MKYLVIHANYSNTIHHKYTVINLLIYQIITLLKFSRQKKKSIHFCPWTFHQLVKASHKVLNIQNWKIAITWQNSEIPNWRMDLDDDDDACVPVQNNDCPVENERSRSDHCLSIWTLSSSWLNLRMCSLACHSVSTCWILHNGLFICTF